MKSDYTSVTEVPGTRTTATGLSRAYSRYRFARQFCDGKDVLEIGCGAGFGLGYLRKSARKVVGGDYTRNLLAAAQAHYEGSIPLVRFDAHALPFPPGSFDVVIVQEALYYFRDTGTVFEEIRRVLRHPGTLVIATVNKRQPDFHPSAFSTRYLDATDLARALPLARFDVEIFGGFERTERGTTARILSLVKRAAVKLGLVPGSLRAREPLKRLFLGPLIPVPPELTDGIAVFDPPRSLAASPHSLFTILYAVARTR